MLELVGLLPGEHTLEVRAIDIWLNADPTPASYTWTSVGEPETTIVSGPPEIDGRPSATIEFTSDQPNSTFLCSFDGSIPTPCSSPYIAGPLMNDMAYTFEVQAVSPFRYIDGEQVRDQSPAVHEWEVLDHEPPTTEIRNVTYLGPTDLIMPHSLRFELVGTDN